MKDNYLINSFINGVIFSGIVGFILLIIAIYKGYIVL